MSESHAYTTKEEEELFREIEGIVVDNTKSGSNFGKFERFFTKHPSPDLCSRLHQMLKDHCFTSVTFEVRGEDLYLAATGRNVQQAIQEPKVAKTA